MRYILICLVILSPTIGIAMDDTHENRVAQMERYLLAVPPEKLFTDMARDISMNFPPDERAEIREFMTEYVDISVLSAAMQESMIKHFTADEIAAMAALYESPAGKSAMAKMGVYMAEVIPVIEAEIVRALGQFQKDKAQANRDTPDSNE